MAKQKGPIKLQGRIGGLSFYESQNEHLVKETGGPSREQVLKQDNFERTRENADEFGPCSKAGRLIRKALEGAEKNLMDKTAYFRLTERLTRVKKSDSQSRRGNRNISFGQLSILERFEFREDARLSDSFFARYEASWDRVAGTCTITIPPFIPDACISVPPHATRVKLMAVALEVDFEKKYARKAESSSEALRLNNQLTDPITLTCSFEGATERSLILVLGLQFMEEYNDICYPMREKDYNSLMIVRAENGPVPTPE